MTPSEEIKIYHNRAEVEADYESFKNNWTYDEDKDTYTHKSGLEMGEDISGISDIEILNLPQWEGSLSKAGMPRDDIETYLSVLSQQFQILVEKNPREEPQKSLEEEMKEWEERDSRMIKWARSNGRSDEYLQQMAEDLKQLHIEMYKRRQNG